MEMRHFLSRKISFRRCTFMFPNPPSSPRLSVHSASLRVPCLFRSSMLALLLIALTLAGCQSIQLPDLFSSSKDAAAEVQPTPTLEPFLHKAVNDLAKRTGLKASAINVTGVIAQAFSEEAFRCETTKEQISGDSPQDVINGHTILLEAGGRRYLYHSDERRVIFCREVE